MSDRLWLAACLLSCAPVAHNAVQDRDTPAPHLTSGTFPNFEGLRLPHTIEPRDYRVRLAIGDSDFAGHIEIAANIPEQTSAFLLHCDRLTVTKAIATRNGVKVSLQFALSPKDELISLR